MPAGRPKGLGRSGGRSKGTPNKATLQKQMIAEVLASPDGQKMFAEQMRAMQQPARGQKKAVETLRELMALSQALVAMHQPQRGADGKLVLDPPAHEKLQVYLPVAVRAASELARYESPTFKAIAVAPVPPAPAERPGEKDGNVIQSLEKRSPQDAAAVYMRLIRGEKAA